MKKLEVVQPRVAKPQLATFTILLGLFIASFILADIIEDNSFQSTNKVAVVPIRGAISIDAQQGFMDGSGTSSTHIVDILKDLDDDDSIHAIILDINSPGGAPVASHEISRAVQQTKKPIIAVIREMGASGAYWIASSADHVIADSLSITGSVGVIGSYLEISGLLERYNITHQQLIAGQYKDIGTPLRPMTTDEENILQSKLNIIREIFINDVSSNRNLSLEQTQEISSALYYVGEEALQLGLIDEIGGMEEAKHHLQENYDIEAEFVYLRTETNILDLLSSVSSQHGYSIGKGITETIQTNQRGLLT